MQLIDIGANLTHESFDQDREDVIQRARDAGVGPMMVTGASRQGSIRAHELAHDYPDTLWATAGVHPHHADEYDDELDQLLRELCQDERVLSAGETGLDFFRDFSPRDAQQRAFEAQLQIAVELEMPVFLHQRDAHARFIEVMREYRDRLPRAVVHCFTDTKKALFDYLDLDLYVGITGWICDERRGAHLKEIVGNIPTGRLMIETDSPYLLPRDLKPKPKTRRNEPMWLPHIAAEIARCREESVEALAEHSSAAARAFFGLQAEPL